MERGRGGGVFPFFIFFLLHLKIMGFLCSATTFFLGLYNLECKKSKDGALKSCCNWSWYLLLPVLLLGTFQVVQALLQFYGFLSGLFRTVNMKKYGDWAVVTGATDGCVLSPFSLTPRPSFENFEKFACLLFMTNNRIGFGYCQTLAKQGVNLVLVSRTKDKLEKCAAELKTINPSIEANYIFSASLSFAVVLIHLLAFQHTRSRSLWPTSASPTACTSASRRSSRRQKWAF